MSEGEQSLSFPRIPSGEEERLARPLLEARGKILSGERPGGGEAVQGGVGKGLPVIRIEQALHRAPPAGCRHGGVEGLAELEHPLFGERCLDCALGREVLVERGVWMPISAASRRIVRALRAGPKTGPDLHVHWWALRDSNPRPQPCEG